jgi:hypothetical protein
VTIAIRRDISFSFALVSNVAKACDGFVEKDKHSLRWLGVLDDLAAPTEGIVDLRGLPMLII